MKNISKKIFPILALAISTGIYAEYMVKIQLDPQGINIDLPSEIAGTAQLTPSTINRGESSTISWSYDYANEVEIEGLGKYGKTGSVNVASLASRIYKINATYGALSKTENLSLTVIQPNSNISFTSSSNRIGIGQSVILSWNVNNARNIDIDNGVGLDMPLISSSEVYPLLDTTFTLKGFDFNDNPILSSVFVDVVPNSIINSFNASELNITSGESVNFNWNVSDSEYLVLSPYGIVSGTPTGSQGIVFNNAGSFDFTLESTSLSGTIISSSPIGINVYDSAIINSYTINDVDTSLNVSPNEVLNFKWTALNSINYKLNGISIGENSTVLTASSSTGTTSYVLEAFNGAGDSVTRSLSVNVVGLPVINTFTGQNNVFSNSPLTLSWTGTGVSKYEIKSNNSNSGIATTTVDLGSSIAINTTPIVAGTYVYTLSAYNIANAKVDLTKSVIVEADPTFTGFTVNGGTNISVSPNTTLTYAGAGFSTGATLQGRNSSNTSNATNPTTAPATAGTYTYYASATKTLNAVIRNSNTRSVSVTVVDAPTISAITSPTTVFVNSAFSMSWSGTNVVNYKIRGNVAASGISTTDVDLGTTASRSITPTAAGNYTYTITATNAAGVTSTNTRVVTVEADPTFTGFTVNSGTNISVSPNAALTFAGAGFSTGAVLVGRNSGNTADATNPANAPVTAGTYTYYATVTKNINSITRYSGLRSVVVNVVENWVATTPTYTSWVNSGGIYGCSNWSPDPSTVNSGVSFTQTANDCEQDQTRNRQNREQESTTLVIRNSGSVIAENQTLTSQSSSRTSTGTKPLGPTCYTMSTSNKWNFKITLSCSGDGWYTGSATYTRSIIINGVTKTENFSRGSGVQNGCRLSANNLIQTFNPGGDVLVNGTNVTLKPISVQTPGVSGEGQVCY